MSARASRIPVASAEQEGSPASLRGGLEHAQGEVASVEVLGKSVSVQPAGDVKSDPVVQHEGAVVQCVAQSLVATSQIQSV